MPWQANRKTLRSHSDRPPLRLGEKSLNPVSVGVAPPVSLPGFEGRRLAGCAETRPAVGKGGEEDGAARTQTTALTHSLFL